MEKNPSKQPDHKKHDSDKYADEPTQDKIHKHLKDPNDHITAEDIEHVNTHMYDAKTEEEEEKSDSESQTTDKDKLSKKKKEDEEKDDDDEFGSHRMGTSWDILGG